jgi:hypothetical protein
MFRVGSLVNTNIHVGFVEIKGEIEHIYGNGWLLLKLHSYNLYVRVKCQNNLWKISDNTYSDITTYVRNHLKVKYLLESPDIIQDYVNENFHRNYVNEIATVLGDFGDEMVIDLL